MPTTGLKFSSWKERLEMALFDEQNFEEDDQINANDWSKCAVGERDDELKNILYSGLTLVHVKKKLSEKVVSLGMDFSEAIYHNDRKGAMSIYNQIKEVPEAEFYLN